MGIMSDGEQTCACVGDDDMMLADDTPLNLNTL